MRDVILAMELLRNYAIRSGISPYATFKVELVFAERQEERLFRETFRRETHPFNIATDNANDGTRVACVNLRFDNEQDIAERKRKALQAISAKQMEPT